MGSGQVGFSTYNTTAKFNKASISFPYGQQPYTETFSDGIANGFSSPEGTFVVSNGTYVDTAVHQTGTAFPPVDFGAGTSGVYYYTMHVRMLNPYGGPGNLMGILFQSSGPGNYHEVVFSPTGVAQVRHVNAGHDRGAEERAAHHSSQCLVRSHSDGEFRPNLGQPQR